MGVFYHIAPLDGELAEFLRASGQGAAKQKKKRSREPTPAEVREACAGLADFHTEFNVRPRSSIWQAVIRGATKGNRNAGTILNVDKFNGGEDEPHSIWFEKGTPSLILEIVRRLARECGALVVVPDTGDAPIAVTGNDLVEKLLREWEHTWEGYE
jgi:hypothetical protein